MLLREKIESLVPCDFSGRARLSAWKESWRRVVKNRREPSSERHAAVAGASDQQAIAPELHQALVTLKGVRKRILANSLLRAGTKELVWLLAGLIAIAVISTRLVGALWFAGVAAILAAAAILVWTWRGRPSDYETAQRLDSAARLQDRISTAVYLGRVEDPDGIIGRQRGDALARLAKVDARGLFPVRMPATIRRAAVLLVVTGGLFAYRIHHQPPLVSLLQTTARSQLVQSILNPIVHAMEKDLQRTMALVGMKPETVGEETKRADTTSNSEDLWKADDKSAPAEEQKEQAQADAGDPQQDEMQSPGNQEGNPSGEARPQDSNSQSQQGKAGNENQDGKSAQQSEQQGPEGRQSLGQSLMQALKNMMSNSPSQQSSNRAQQPPNGQGAPQSGNSQQPGATQSDQRGDSRGSSDAKQKATQTASEGAGSQQGTKELQKNQETHPVNAVPDRVALEASGFKEQTRMKVATETGSAQLTTNGATPRQEVVTNGAEQENIPARYRFYVQRYFEHADNGKH